MFSLLLAIKLRQERVNCLMRNTNFVNQLPQDIAHAQMDMSSMVDPKSQNEKLKQAYLMVSKNVAKMRSTYVSQPWTSVTRTMLLTVAKLSSKA